MNFLHILAGIVAILMLVIGIGVIGYAILNRKDSDAMAPSMMAAGICLMLLCLVPGCIASGGTV